MLLHIAGSDTARRSKGFQNTFRLFIGPLLDVCINLDEIMNFALPNRSKITLALVGSALGRGKLFFKQAHLFLRNFRAFTPLTLWRFLRFFLFTRSRSRGCLLQLRLHAFEFRRQILGTFS